MATIIRIKPLANNTETVFVGYVRSFITLNYAILIARAKNDMRTETELKNGVTFEVIDMDFERVEFYQMISEAHFKPKTA